MFVKMLLSNDVSYDYLNTIISQAQSSGDLNEVCCTPKEWSFFPALSLRINSCLPLLGQRFSKKAFLPVLKDLRARVATVDKVEDIAPFLAVRPTHIF